MRWVMFLAGILGASGVTIGAHAAHGLEVNLSEQLLAPEEIAKRLEQCDVAVRYHLLHALALLTLGVSPSESARRRQSLAAVFFVLGVVLFSGGLYSMVFLGQMWHWAIVPGGGLCFILGWLCVAMLSFSRRTSPAN